MNRTSGSVRRLLCDKTCAALQILFGEGSEIAVFKAQGYLSVGVSLRGGDLRREKEITSMFEKAGGVTLERSPRILLEGEVRRALLIQFDTKAKVLASMNALKKWTKGRVQFIVRPAQLTVVWQKFTLEPPK